jgi:hypothetical protein
VQACTDDVNEWMSEAVSISPDGAVHIGTYDGYGRIDSAEEAVGCGATVYHRACWELEGRPVTFYGESTHSADQGWFFDVGEHDLPDPRLEPQPAACK